MIQGGVPCFEVHINGGVPGDLYRDIIINSNLDGAGDERLKTQSMMRSFQMSLLVLKEKVVEVESFVSFFLPQENHYLSHTQLVYEPNSSMAFSSMANLMQEIVETASSMMLNCQQMALGSAQEGHNNSDVNSNSEMNVDQVQLHTIQAPYNGVNKGYNEGMLGDDSFYNWYIQNTSYNGSNNITTGTTRTTTSMTTALGGDTNDGHEVVEVDAEDLLARYTHYCQVCGRGFKREANLRMHMRAHGDKYKSSTLVSANPLKKKMGNEESTAPRKYSCPQEGCRWNKNHAKFTPLKSMVCVRNHYKRSHCPKMFVCKRCNTKEFSVLSDLKTHEKHCGEINWYCSCGTSFSKKDKLMDHVALFVGHAPLITTGYQFGQQP